MSIAKRVANVLCGGRCNVDLYRNVTVGNAFTFVLPSGTAKIVYKPNFMTTVEQNFGEGAVFGILSHEVGHVIDGRLQVAWMLDSWSRELRADAWAGCALARANLSTTENPQRASSDLCLPVAYPSRVESSRSST
jgi:hypothetical protein